MADLKITELPSLAGADLAATDPLAVASLAASDTKKITAKAFTQQAVTLIDDASIPVAKVNLSGISGTNLTDGTVTATKLNTSSIPATGGLAVSSGNLGLVAPTSPIVRNAGTGSLEHATSGATAGTYTKVTVDAKGHVTAGTTLAAADIPLATSSVVGGISVGSGLSVTGGGVLNHSNSVSAGTTSGITRDAQGHITGVVALVSADLPVASTGVPGAVSPGTGTSVNGAGALSVTAATSSALGGVIVGGDFAVSTGTISLATQSGLAAGTYPKLTVTTKGIVTAGTSLVASDIPNLDTSKITTGTLSVSLLGTNSITGAKLANYSTIQFGGAGSTSGVVTFPTPDFTGQGFYDSTNQDYYIYDGNTWQPLTVISGNLVYAGTYNANTNRVASVTTAGTAGGLVIGSALPAGSATLNQYYVVVSESGNGVSPAPVVALAPPDMIICNGATWDLVDVSNAIAGQTATNISFTPYGNIAATNVQTALQELDDEKIAKTGGVVTGELLIGSAGTFGFEGSTNNAYETYLSAVDPTADRAIVFPDQSGNVIVSGNASIVNADINANAGIAYSKLATLTSGSILVGNGSNVATSVAMSGDVTITNAGVAAIASNVIVDGDISASAGIVDTKLATIATAGKVSNSATTAASANTASAIVARDASGNFIAGTPTLANVILDDQGDIRFREATANGTNYVGFQGPATIAADVLWTLPAADGSASQVLSTNGSGTLSWATAAAGGTILYNRRPALYRGPLFSKTAATTISVAAGAVLNGQYYASATAVTMGTHTNSTDMAIWQHPTTGALVSDASFVTAPAGATGGSIVGGYHYIPSGRPTAFNNGSPTSTAEILEYSIWDLTWRPTCPDPRGMACIDGRFWCDLYLCGSTSYATTAFSAVPSSKIGLTIADNNSPVLIPSFYGGNGSTAYSLTGGNNPGSWYNFAEVAHSFGKRFMHSWEFQAAAFGAPEAGSRGSDPGTVIWERASKWGLAQATGTIYVWAVERVGIYTSGSNTNTGGRGMESADAPRALLVGGPWDGGAESGSRYANWNNGPSLGYNSIGARFASEHLVLG